ncbi:MAG: sugar transferase [Candidatus Acidiferrum sp.]|jgi:lipopolysaccharide/colanic/teichoic acid biosynthesis glycosyltransferase
MSTEQISNSDKIKRCLDFVVSLIALIVLSPILLAVALIIKIGSPGPILYRGLRIGLRGHSFHICKFRTMVIDAEKLGGSATAEDDPRITPIGKFLRRHKLDELPQFLNVLFGDMSLVGPRPEVQKYIEMYNEEERTILELRPGITDWASIWNSNEAAVLEGSKDPEKAYEELIRPTKVALQLFYARNHSLGIDFKILLHTFCKLLFADWTPRELVPYGKVRLYKMVSQVPTP